MEVGDGVSLPGKETVITWCVTVALCPRAIGSNSTTGSKADETGDERPRLRASLRKLPPFLPSSLRNKAYEERLASLKLFSLSKRRLRGKLIECLKILKEFTKAAFDELFLIDNTTRTRGNGHKLRGSQVRTDCMKYFFTNDIVKEWNKLPTSVVQCDTINSFKEKHGLHLHEQSYH